MLRVKASPDFIPHEKWDEHAWLLPPPHGNEPWYYAVRRRAHPSKRAPVTEKSFTETVDMPLRELVEFFHEREIPTGPSCAGHEIKTDEFRNIYDGLLKNRRSVRREGLPLWDPEAQRVVHFKDRRYEVPWASFPDFLAHAKEHQLVGWLPFYTQDPRAKKIVGDYRGFKIVEPREGTFAVRTEEPSVSSWGRATHLVHDALF